MLGYWRKYDHGTYLNTYIDIQHDIIYVAEYHRLTKLVQDMNMAGNDFDKLESVIQQWLDSVQAHESCNKWAKLQIKNRYAMLLAIGQCMQAGFYLPEDTL